MASVFWQVKGMLEPISELIIQWHQVDHHLTEGEDGSSTDDLSKPILSSPMARSN